MSARVVLESIPYLLRGTLVTVGLSLAVIALGSAVGLTLGVLRFVPWRGVGRGIGWAVELVRAGPLLLLMFFIFFGLPAIGVGLPTLPPAVLSMRLWVMVNTAEGVLGGIQSIPAGPVRA